MFVLKLILYSVKFEETKMDLEKSYTNHQYIPKIWLYIGYAREIEKKIRFAAITNPILLKKKITS